MDPHFAVAHYQLGQALEQKHRHDEAIAEFRRAIELSGGNTTFESNLANAYAVSGRKEEAMKIVKDLESRQSQDSSTDASIALIYVGLGDNDRAMSVAKALQAEGFDVRAIRPPSVPEGTARLRISVNAGLSERELDTFASILSAALCSAACS